MREVLAAAETAPSDSSLFRISRRVDWWAEWAPGRPGDDECADATYNVQVILQFGRQPNMWFDRTGLVTTPI